MKKSQHSRLSSAESDERAEASNNRDRPRFSAILAFTKAITKDNVRGRKPIDRAVQSAGNAVSSEFGLDSREFAAHVLYMRMRAQDGDVF